MPCSLLANVVAVTRLKPISLLQTVVGHSTKCLSWIRKTPPVRTSDTLRIQAVAYYRPSPPALVNVFKVKHGKETHVYRTDSSSDKKNMLAQFRHIAEELSARRRKEREGEHERRKSLW